jgi:hypothetical protein
LPFSGFLRLDRNGPLANDEMNQIEKAARIGNAADTALKLSAAHLEKFS